MSDGERPQRRYRVERYVPGIGIERLRAELGRVAAAAAEAAAEGEPVRYLGSVFAPEEESCFSSFEGESRQVVERLYARARLPFAHVVEEECLPEEPTASGRAEEGR
jgi:hypothetical protein